MEHKAANLTQNELKSLSGEFTWFWSDKFFIETEVGNFVWHDPEYGGENLIHPTNMTYQEFCDYTNISHGRDKGIGLISARCIDASFNMQSTIYMRKV